MDVTQREINHLLVLPINVVDLVGVENDLDFFSKARKVESARILGLQTIKIHQTAQQCCRDNAEQGQQNFGYWISTLVCRRS